MGWSGGSVFAEKYIEVCRKYVKNKKERKELYKSYIEFLTDEDWDCTEESFGHDPVWDEALKEWYKANDLEFDEP